MSKTIDNIIAINCNVRLIASDPKTGKVKDVVDGHNVVCTVGKCLIADMMIDTSGYDTGITYCAIGTDDTAVAAGDTTLTVETARKMFTSRTRASNVITFSTFYLSSECTYNIKEVGLFGHSTATGTTDSGILFNHALMSYDNSAGNYDLTIEITVTVG